MHLAARPVLLAFAILLCATILFPAAQSRAAERAVVGPPVGISSGKMPRPASDSEKRILEYFGLPPDTTTDDAIQGLTGGCDYNPYEILENQHRGGDSANRRCNPSGQVHITPQANNTAGLDSALACRLTKLFKAANDRGCQVKIISAYRSEGQQRCMCGSGGSGCAAAGRSCHQRGLAVDVSGGCVGWLRMVAPQFHLVFPYYGDHIQCSEHPRASVSSCNRPCTGGIAISPDLSGFPAPSQVPESYFVPPSSASAAPSSGLSNAIRNFLNPQPQQQQQMCALPDGNFVPCSSIANQGGLPSENGTSTPQGPPPPKGTVNTTPYLPGTCMPELYCLKDNLYFRSSACVDEIKETCPEGCEGTSCKDSRQNVSDILGSALSEEQEGSSSTSSKKTSTSSLSAFEQISLLINPEAVGTAEIPEPLILTIGEEEAATLEGRVPPPGSPLPQGATYVPPSFGAQQTFTSGDLRDSVSQETAQTRTTLTIMREVLLRILDYLKPFHGRVPGTEMMLE